MYLRLNHSFALYSLKFLLLLSAMTTIHFIYDFDSVMIHSFMHHQNFSFKMRTGCNIFSLKNPSKILTTNPFNYGLIVCSMNLIYIILQYIICVLYCMFTTQSKFPSITTDLSLFILYYLTSPHPLPLW